MMNAVVFTYFCGAQAVGWASIGQMRRRPSEKRTHWRIVLISEALLGVAFAVALSIPAEYLGAFVMLTCVIAVIVGIARFSRRRCFAEI